MHRSGNPGLVCVCFWGSRGVSGVPVEEGNMANYHFALTVQVSEEKEEALKPTLVICEMLSPYQ